MTVEQPVAWRMWPLPNDGKYQALTASHTVMTQRKAAGWFVEPLVPQSARSAVQSGVARCADCIACGCKKDEAALSRVPTGGEAETATRRAVQSGDDWREDPGADERWNAGVDFALEQLGKYLGVDLASITWDGATETVEGDVDAVIGHILCEKFGEDWGPKDVAQAQPKWFSGPLGSEGIVEACIKVVEELKIRTAAKDAGNGYRHNKLLDEVVSALRGLIPASPVPSANREPSK